MCINNGTRLPKELQHRGGNFTVDQVHRTEGNSRRNSTPYTDGNINRRDERKYPSKVTELAPTGLTAARE